MADIANVKKNNQSHHIPTDLLNDLSSRFIINVPEEERVDLIRVCFQIELAHWFYLDFYCEEDPNLPKCLLKDFIRIIFGHIPFLQKYSVEVDSVIANWKEYKMAVPTYGAILLDKEMKNVLLVQSYVYKSSWGFPKGKVNKDESPHHCAIREVLEETGFDITPLIDKTEYLEHYFNDQLIRLYIITGVPPNVKFHPKTRKEIKSIEWFPVNSLPSGRKDQVCKTTLRPISFFMVIPFVKQLKKWISSKLATLQDPSPEIVIESEKYIMQQNLFARLSQNELLNYRDIKTTVENNSVHSNEINRGSRSSHNKSTYSPPPRMIRQKNLKQALDAKRERPMSSQTEERVHPKPFRKALEFTKETKNNKEQSYMKKETFYPCSKTWANFSLDTEALIAVFNMNMDLREKALSVTGNKGVEAAMEWLLAHQEELENAENTSVVEKCGETGEHNGSTKSDAEQLQELTEELAAEAKCIKCDECNKKFRTDSEIEFHAVKTGHQTFSESTEEIKPLSEEEKMEQMKKLESIIRQRRAEKAEQEKKEALEREKNRRKTGQEITHARQKLQEEEIKRMAEMKRREKLEDKLARQRILEEIERDKQRRKEKFGLGGAAAPNVAPAPTPVPAPVESPPSTNETFTECKLQVRLTNGQCLTQTFSPNEELAAVRLYVEMNRTDGSAPFTLMTNFPKKVFSDEDMHLSLNSLGLCPSAVLIVSRKM